MSIPHSHPEVKRQKFFVCFELEPQKSDRQAIFVLSLKVSMMSLVPRSIKALGTLLKPGTTIPSSGLFLHFSTWQSGRGVPMYHNDVITKKSSELIKPWNCQTFMQIKILQVSIEIAAMICWQQSLWLETPHRNKST